MNLEGHYIYCHFNPLTDEPFNIGMGSTKTRPWDMYHRSKGHKKAVAEHGVRVSVIADGLTREQACFWETAWIKALKIAGYDLVNVLPGGDGMPSEIAKVIQNNPETNAKRSKSISAAYANMSQEQKDYISSLRHSIQGSDEVRKKVSIGNKISQNKPEVKARKSAAIKNAKNTPEFKAKNSATQLVVQKRPDVIAKKSSSMAKMHSSKSPEERAAIIKKGHETRKRNQQLKDI